MQYTEEDYAQMYNDLPEGLKELVLSGRLAILVSAIGSRHGLNADQVADLEPSIEDVCLGLITKDELVDNILKNVNVDQRVANRIAAEAELEILRPFESELVIARKQKEDLDQKISKTNTVKPTPTNVAANTVYASPKSNEPKDVSDHGQEKKVADWYHKGEEGKEKNPNQKNEKVSFDWDKDFAKKPDDAKAMSDKAAPEPASLVSSPNIENKLDQLTESINKLVSTRFGSPDKKEEGVSSEMQELLKRLEKAEKENEENKKLIKSMQGQNVPPLQNIFGDKQTKIQIDKERKVGIDHTEEKKAEVPSGNIQITSVSKNIPIQKDGVIKKEPEIISSTVSKDTLDSIMEIRNRTTPIEPVTSTKRTLSLDELISKNDGKIKESVKPATSVGTLVFPGLNDEKKIDIKNMAQKDNLRKTLLEDIEFLTKKSEETEKVVETSSDTPEQKTEVMEEKVDDAIDSATTSQTTTATNTNPFKDELLPKTKEDRMKALQDKIKALNKGVSVGGKTNISASSLDPYRS